MFGKRHTWLHNVMFAIVGLVFVISIVGCNKRDAETLNTETTGILNDIEFTDGFRIMRVGEAKCAILGCKIDDETLIVPDTIEGNTVIGIGTNGLCGIQAKKVILPDTVEFLAQNAFNNCENLEEVELGHGLTRTDLRVFNNCNKLLNVTFPNSLTEMADICFGFCENLKEVYVPDSVTIISAAILDPEMCPNAVIVTPTKSLAEANAIEYNIPYRNN